MNSGLFEAQCWGDSASGQSYTGRDRYLMQILLVTGNVFIL